MSSINKNRRYIFRYKILTTKFYLSLFTTLFFLVFSTNVFAQTPSLAEKVFDKYQTLLQREDIKEVIPLILVEIKKPETQALLTPDTINIVVDNPDLLKTFVPDIEDEFITLLKEDQEIQGFLRDTDVQSLLQDINAIDELTELLRLAELSLAARVAEVYEMFLQREDMRELLPTILATLKKPDIQALITPELLESVEDNPDVLKTVMPSIDEKFITLLKEDAEVMTFISDSDVQLLLQTPTAIDELAELLNFDLSLPVIVRIVPAAVESPLFGEQLIITQVATYYQRAS